MWAKCWWLTDVRLLCKLKPSNLSLGCLLMWGGIERTTQEPLFVLFQYQIVSFHTSRRRWDIVVLWALYFHSYRWISGWSSASLYNQAEASSGCGDGVHRFSFLNAKRLYLRRAQDVTSRMNCCSCCWDAEVTRQSEKSYSKHQIG